MSKDSKALLHESWAAILMSLTALVTAWSAYQANLWTGVQSVELANALDNQIILSNDEIAANQIRMMDGILVLNIIEAMLQNQTAQKEFLVSRLREDLRQPITEWLALDPVNNRDAPAHPLLMPSYIKNVMGKFESKRVSVAQEFKDNMQSAQNAGGLSDSYVLLTVLFAAVLFFAGIASTFSIPKFQSILLTVSTVLMLASFAYLFTLKVAVD